jgi:hypothetical protein
MPQMRLFSARAEEHCARKVGLKSPARGQTTFRRRARAREAGRERPATGVSEPCGAGSAESRALSGGWRFDQRAGIDGSAIFWLLLAVSARF